MAIATLTSTESGADSLIDINANFADLDTTKADLASPALTGNPTAPTQSASDNSTKIATTAYADAAVAAVSTPTYFSITQVFTGTSPASFTDLDLSAVVGAQQRMVMLKVFCDNETKLFIFRPNGDTGEYNGTAFNGVNAVTTPSDGYALAICKTDTAGVIEWRTTGAENACTISVEAYW